MKDKDKDSTIKELKNQIRELREKLSANNPQELTDLPEKAVGVFAKNGKYYVAELSFNGTDGVAKVEQIREADKNPRSYSLMRLRANEYLNLHILDKMPIITA